MRPATLLKRLWHRCFPVNFAKFLKRPFLQNTSSGCFWCFLLIPLKNEKSENQRFSDVSNGRGSGEVKRELFLFFFNMYLRSKNHYDPSIFLEYIALQRVPGIHWRTRIVAGNQHIIRTFTLAHSKQKVMTKIFQKHQKPHSETISDHSHKN